MARQPTALSRDLRHAYTNVRDSYRAWCERRGNPEPLARGLDGAKPKARHPWRAADQAEFAAAQQKRKGVT